MPSPTSDLSPADARRLEAARGFFGLGLHLDAWEELEAIQPTARAGAEVLALRAEILLAMSKTEDARTIATGATRMHPEDGGCHYGLALVEAAAGDLPAAKASLAVAFGLDPKLREPALDDERLVGFWRTVGE